MTATVGVVARRLLPWLMALGACATGRVDAGATATATATATGNATAAATATPSAASAASPASGSAMVAIPGSTAATTAARPLPHASGPEPTAPARYVLVRAGAFFHTAVPPAGRRAHGAGETSDAAAPRASARFRLVGQAGDWTEIETVAADANRPHCHSPSALFSGLAVHLFVATADLQPVTTRRVHVAFAEGAVDLEPGVPVVVPPVGHDGTRGTAYPDENLLPIDLAGDIVGTSYVPALTHAIAAHDKVLAADAAIALGGLEINLGARRAAACCEQSSGRDGALAPYVQQAVPVRDGRMDVTVQTTCATYAGTVDGAALQDARRPFPDDRPLLRLSRARFAARAGAPLSWSDGTPAGKIAVLGGGNLPIADDANPDRQQPCFEWPLGSRGGGPETGLRVCLASSDLVESPAFLSDQQVAVVSPRTRRQVTLTVDNQTARARAEVESLVRVSARRRLFARGDLVLVPPGEDEAISASRATHNHLTRYRLKLSIEETLGAPGQMSSRLVTTTLVRLDGTADGQKISSAESRQFQSSRNAAEETDALDELIDGAMQGAAEALEDRHP